jgi:hypothetical protein
MSVGGASSGGSINASSCSKARPRRAAMCLGHLPPQYRYAKSACASDARRSRWRSRAIRTRTEIPVMSVDLIPSGRAATNRLADRAPYLVRD